MCQTAGFGELILPSWGASVETIQQIAIDDSRKLVYTLGSKSTIKTFYLNSPTTVSQVITYTFPSVLSHISILSASSPLLDPRNTTIVGITPIQAAESGRIYLVATTNSRVRLYIRAIKGYGSFGGSNDPVNSMQVIHVRFPPEQQTGQFSVRSPPPSGLVANTVIVTKPSTMSFLQIIPPRIVLCGPRTPHPIRQRRPLHLRSRPGKNPTPIHRLPSPHGINRIRNFCPHRRLRPRYLSPLHSRLRTLERTRLAIRFPTPRVRRPHQHGSPYHSSTSCRRGARFAYPWEYGPWRRRS